MWVFYVVRCRDEEETAAAIREIRRQQREANQAIEKLKKEVTYNKNALEIKKMAEQLQANRVRDISACFSCNLNNVWS